MSGMVHNLKFSESGVRGIVGDSFTPMLVSSLASSFGKYVGGGRVIVGRDTRATGEMLEHAVVAGLLAVGCQPVILGIVPTPTVQLMVEEYNANGGIAITASHNPSEWNALKFIGSRGMFLDRNESAELFDIYTQGNLDYSFEQDFREPRFDNTAFERHMRRIFAEIDVEAIRERKFKVAVDCCNGVGALYSRRFLEALGCEVYTVFDKAEGYFERTPEPVSENIGELCRTVKDNGCAVGFAHDPDGDRMALVDDNGHALGTQYTILLAVDHLLSENPGAVAVNIQTTKAVEDVVNSYGCELYYSKVGEINVVEKMLECGAEIGGEGNSAGIIWRRIHPGRDSYVAMALMLEMLALSGEAMSDICSSMPKYYNQSLKFKCGAYRCREIVLELGRRYSEYETLKFDGLRINMKDSWTLIRGSNTEPVLRLTVEAASEQEVERLISKFSKEINDMISADEQKGLQ
jgi:phosphomannomutase